MPRPEALGAVYELQMQQHKADSKVSARDLQQNSQETAKHYVAPIDIFRAGIGQ